MAPNKTKLARRRSPDDFSSGLRNPIAKRLKFEPPSPTPVPSKIQLRSRRESQVHEPKPKISKYKSDQDVKMELIHAIMKKDIRVVVAPMRFKIRGIDPSSREPVLFHGEHEVKFKPLQVQVEKLNINSVIYENAGAVDDSSDDQSTIGDSDSIPHSVHSDYDCSAENESAEQTRWMDEDEEDMNDNIINFINRILSAKKDAIDAPAPPKLSLEDVMTALRTNKFDKSDNGQAAVIEILDLEPLDLVDTLSEVLPTDEDDDDDYTAAKAKLEAEIQKLRDADNKGNVGNRATSATAATHLPSFEFDDDDYDFDDLNSIIAQEMKIMKPDSESFALANVERFACDDGPPSPPRASASATSLQKSDSGLFAAGYQPNSDILNDEKIFGNISLQDLQAVDLEGGFWDLVYNEKEKDDPLTETLFEVYVNGAEIKNLEWEQQLGI